MNTIETRLEEMLAEYQHESFMADQLGICKPNPDLPKLVQALRRSLQENAWATAFNARETKADIAKILTEGKE